LFVKALYQHDGVLLILAVYLLKDFEEGPMVRDLERPLLHCRDVFEE